MSLLSKLTLGAAAVLGVYALKPRRATKATKGTAAKAAKATKATKAGSASSPGHAHKAAAGGAARKRRPAENGAHLPKARTRSRPARRASGK